MGASLAFVWCILGGAIMFLARNRVRGLVQRSPFGPKTTFFLFATALALLEEGVTTTLTNLAPVFGNGAAFITASRNYLEVVLFHSVVVFLPMFAVWSWLLSRFVFAPAAVFLLFGANGILAELLLGGPALLMAPFWIYVYGLMIYLPAFSFPVQPSARLPRWFHYPLAVFSCLVASAALAILVIRLSPHLPHFAPELKYPKETSAVILKPGSRNGAFARDDLREYEIDG